MDIWTSKRTTLKCKNPDRIEVDIIYSNKEGWWITPKGLGKPTKKYFVKRFETRWMINFNDSAKVIPK